MSPARMCTAPALSKNGKDSGQLLRPAPRDCPRASRYCPVDSFTTEQYSLGTARAAAAHGHMSGVRRAPWVCPPERAGDAEQHVFAPVGGDELHAARQPLGRPLQWEADGRLAAG